MHEVLMEYCQKYVFKESRLNSKCAVFTMPNPNAHCPLSVKKKKKKNEAVDLKNDNEDYKDLD